MLNLKPIVIGWALTLGTVMAQTGEHQVDNAHLKKKRWKSKPQLIGLLAGKPHNENFVKNHHSFFGIFSQHPLAEMESGALHTKMSVSLYQGEGDGAVIKTADFKQHSAAFANTNLVKLNYWYEYCNSKSGEHGICVDLGLSLLTWTPLEASNSYYGVGSQLYYKSGYLDFGKPIEIQAGISIESLLGDGVKLNLRQYFLGMGFAIGNPGSD